MQLICKTIIYEMATNTVLQKSFLLLTFNVFNDKSIYGQLLLITKNIFFIFIFIIIITLVNFCDFS